MIVIIHRIFKKHRPTVPPVVLREDGLHRITSAFVGYELAAPDGVIKPVEFALQDFANLVGVL